jgi:hypothetical protein
MSDAKQRTAKPGDLLSQWWTLGRIAADRRTTGRHVKAGWVIINSYWQKHGNGRASLRFIERATGLGRPAVVRACRELAEWGHVTRVPGVGSRSSEYVPRWVTSASGVQITTTNDDDPSGVQMDTTPVSEATPLDGASGVEMDTESYLPEPAYKPASGKVDDDCAAPTAPPLAGLAPATAGTAQEELPSAQAKPTFELCYRTYDYLRGKNEANAAWNALPPEVDRAAVIKAAAAWQASWAAQGKPDAPRKHLATLLKEERYDEDAPTGFQKVEKSSKAKQATGKPAKARHGIGHKMKRYTIVDVAEEGSVFGSYFLTFTFRAGEGEHEFTQRLHVVQADAEFAEGADTAEYRELCTAAFGKGKPEGNYLGRVIGINEGNDRVWYHHLPGENPSPAEAVTEPQPASRPLTEAIARRREPSEWERKKAAQWRRDAGWKEWDKAHPEFFETPAGEGMSWAQAIKASGHEDKPAADDEWPEWMDTEYDEDDEAA